MISVVIACYIALLVGMNDSVAEGIHYSSLFLVIWSVLGLFLGLVFQMVEFPQSMTLPTSKIRLWKFRERNKEWKFTIFGLQFSLVTESTEIPHPITLPDLKWEFTSTRLLIIRAIIVCCSMVMNHVAVGLMLDKPGAARTIIECALIIGLCMCWRSYVLAIQTPSHGTVTETKTAVWAA